MVVKQFANTTENDLEATQVPTIDTFVGRYGLIEYEIATDMGGSIPMYPIKYVGESVLLNPIYMNVDEAYSFIFSGHRLVAIKQKGGSIDFYYLDEME
jgi:hypothetical protein